MRGGGGTLAARRVMGLNERGGGAAARRVAGAGSTPAAGPGLAAPPPLTVYVHLPWCVRKCPYCDFNSHAPRSEPDFGRYVAAVLADLESELPAIWGRSVQAVFLGGGTPSLFPPAAIGRLLDGIAARLRIAPGAEITLEANPGAADSDRFRGFVAAGVTRLSIGVQSFDDGLLEAIGRVHDGAAARAAVRAALTSGARHVNADLMFALPGQDLAGVAADVAEALALGVRHVSFYQLTLEPGTVFHRRPPVLPAHDRAARMQDAGMDLLAREGLRRYEVSAFAAPGERSRHNLNYWRFGDYVGLGAGAHGKLTLPGQLQVLRTARPRSPERYMALAGARPPPGERRPVASADLPFEFMLNALRLSEGFEESLFESRTGLALAAVEPVLAGAVADGLLERSGGHLRPTALGARFLDDLVGRFLPG